MTIQPGKYNLTIVQGATLEEAITWQDAQGNPIDLTGYTARAQARQNYEDATPFMNLTTENGGIILGGANGQIKLSLNASATAAITAETGMWDLELVTASGAVYRLLQGSVTISKEVTR
jgi:hypothetical protein